MDGTTLNLSLLCWLVKRLLKKGGADLIETKFNDYISPAKNHGERASGLAEELGKVKRYGLW